MFSSGTLVLCTKQDLHEHQRILTEKFLSVGQSTLAK